MFEKYKRPRITDFPKTNMERTLNFCYAGNGEIYARFYNGERHVNVNRIAREYMELTDAQFLEDMKDDEIFETLLDCDYENMALVLLMAATQAAELRGVVGRICPSELPKFYVGDTIYCRPAPMNKLIEDKVASIKFTRNDIEYTTDTGLHFKTDDIGSWVFANVPGSTQEDS